MQGSSHSDEDIKAYAKMLLALIEGHMHQYMRSGFKRSPLELWPEQWQQLSAVLFAG